MGNSAARMNSVTAFFMTASALLQFPSLWKLISWTTVLHRDLFDGSQVHSFHYCGPVIPWQGPVTSWKQMYKCTWFVMPLDFPCFKNCVVLCPDISLNYWACDAEEPYCSSSCSARMSSIEQPLCIVMTQRKGQMLQKSIEIIKKNCSGACTSKYSL